MPNIWGRAIPWTVKKFILVILSCWMVKTMQVAKMKFFFPVKANRGSDPQE